MCQRNRFLDDAYLFAREGDLPPLALFAVTSRVTDGLHLFRPDHEEVELLKGVIGRAQALFPAVQLYAVEYLSTHVTLLIGVPSLEHKADFLCHLLGRSAYETNVHRDRLGAFFERRNTPIQISDEAQAEARLAYTINQPSAAHIVRHAKETPFVSSSPWLLEGEPISGPWLDRDGLNTARLVDPDVSEEEFTEIYPLRFDKLPHLAHLSDEDYRAFCMQLADDGAREALDQRKETGKRLLGANAARAVDPFKRIVRRKQLGTDAQGKPFRSPPPLLHGSKPQQKAHREKRLATVEAYRKITARLRAWLSGADLIPERYPSGTIAPAIYHRHRCAIAAAWAVQQVEAVP